MTIEKFLSYLVLICAIVAVTVFVLDAVLKAIRRKSWYVPFAETTSSMTSGHVDEAQVWDGVLLILGGIILIMVSLALIGEDDPLVTALAIPTAVIMNLAWVACGLWLALRIIYRRDPIGNVNVLFALSPTAWGRALFRRVRKIRR